MTPQEIEQIADAVVDKLMTRPITVNNRQGTRTMPLQQLLRELHQKLRKVLT